jgi:hypothetical protein
MSILVPRCQAVKKNGYELCSREAMSGSMYCRQHTNSYLKSMNMLPIKKKSNKKSKSKKFKMNPFMQGQMNPFMQGMQGQMNPFMQGMQGQMNPFMQGQMNPFMQGQMNPFMQGMQGQMNPFMQGMQGQMNPFMQGMQGQMNPFMQGMQGLQGQMNPFMQGMQGQMNPRLIMNPNNPFDPLVCMNKSDYSKIHTRPLPQTNKDYASYCSGYDSNNYSDIEKNKIKRITSEFIFSKNNTVSIDDLISKNSIDELCALANVLANA